MTDESENGVETVHTLETVAPFEKSSLNLTCALVAGVIGVAAMRCATVSANIEAVTITRARSGNVHRAGKELMLLSIF